jgi:cytochrome P450
MTSVLPTVHELDLPVMDLRAIETHAEKVAHAQAIAEQSWLAKVPLGFGLTRYEDVVAVLRDRRFHQLARLIPELSGAPEKFGRRRESILSAEGEDHTRLRRLVAPAFSPKSADALRPFMREVINELVDAIALTGRSEFVADVCEPYPIPIICELLGAPKEDWRLFSRWAADLLRIFNFDPIANLPYIEAARTELNAYVRELIARRRNDPRPDLLSSLIAAEEAGDRLSEEELEVMVEAVIVGGTDTTRNQLACAMALFAEHPDQWRLLRERPELAPNAVDEVMRVLGAVRGTGRFASEDVEFHDVLFPKGTIVLTSFLAANHDDTRFPDPLRFDITRPAPAQHLSFGSGIHYCLGASLARAELQEALPLLANRMPNMEVDGVITWKSFDVAIWGPERLPLKFTPTN